MASKKVKAFLAAHGDITPAQAKLISLYQVLDTDGVVTEQWERDTGDLGDLSGTLVDVTARVKLQQEIAREEEEIERLRCAEIKARCKE